MHGSSGGPCCPGPGVPGRPGRRWLEGRPPPVASPTCWSGSPPRRPGRLRGCSPPCRATGGALTLAALARLVAINLARFRPWSSGREHRPLEDDSAVLQLGGTWTTPCSGLNAPSILGAMVVAAGSSRSLSRQEMPRARGGPRAYSASSPYYRRLRRARSRMTAVSTRVAKNWFAATPGDTFQV
jgi:hypothetical protein